MRQRKISPKKSFKKERSPIHQHRLRDRNVFIREPVPMDVAQDLLGISNDQLTGLYQEAYQMLEQEANVDAVRSFTMLCHLHPYVPDFWLGLGKALSACGEYEEALSMLLTAETLDPSRFEMYQESILCCLAKGDKQEARHIFKRLVAHRTMIDDYKSHREDLRILERKM